MSIKKYTTLKEFIEGLQILYKSYGDIPVFLKVDDNKAPFGIVYQESSNNSEYLVLVGYSNSEE